MKKIVSGLLCLLLALLSAPAPAQHGASDMVIAAATDLHVNPAFLSQAYVNPLEPYHLQIVDAFLWDAVGRGVDVLLLLGDITNQGKLAQHEALLEKLRAAQAQGLAIYVLPGNHDIGEADTARFAELYADFGYGQALSRDEASLSYTVLLGDRLLLMLDTNGYTGQRNTALLTEKTLQWMQAQLAQARESGWQVIAAGHYPLLTQHSTPFAGGDEAVRLLRAYDVPLYLCGHLHKRCVTAADGLTELVVDQTISYPCCYATLHAQGEGEYRYQPQPIAVGSWAAQQKIADANLLAFDAYQQQLEQARCRDVVERLRRDQQITPQERQLAEDFFWKLSDYRAHGTLSRYADMLRQHPGCELLIRLGEGTIYSRWIPSVLSDAVPYTTGFVLRDGELFNDP
ncbi:MAG: metallophosphoesterase [Candidatus Ventricola sp.]